MIALDDIYGQLRRIKDPCSVAAGRPIDIVALGLVGEIAIDGGHVQVSLVLTEPACWFSRNIAEMVETAVRQVEGVESVEAELDGETIWTPDRIADRGWWNGKMAAHEQP